MIKVNYKGNLIELEQLPNGKFKKPDFVKELSGSFGGMQVKPALEVCLVVMKPLETKTFTEQAMKNGHGCTWLDDGRIPYKNNYDKNSNGFKDKKSGGYVAFTANGGTPCNEYQMNDAGRFPANLLVSDDALNDGNVYESAIHGEYKVDDNDKYDTNVYGKYNPQYTERGYNDSGSFSRYFSLDAWWAERLKNFPKSVLQTFPFLIEPKASKGEKNFGCGGLKNIPAKSTGWSGESMPLRQDGTERKEPLKTNSHPTVKPVKLMSYLITLGSRENEIIYDPFCGSGSTGVAAEMLNRKWILSETDKDSCTIAEKRLYPFKIVQKLF